MVDGAQPDSAMVDASAQKASDLDAGKIDAQIEAAQELIDKGNTSAGLEAFLTTEKQCRLAEDLALSKKTCLALINALFHKSDAWTLFIEHISILTKRRGQLKSTIQAIVRRCSEFLDGLPKDKQIELILALQTVTEGKLFVEIDRARLTKRLAHIYEQDGDVGKAADAMQEIAVETFGAMHRSEKVAYVLEQMRLCMDNSDFTRAQILSRKVSPRAFAAGSKDQEAGEISLQGTAIEVPEAGTPSMPELKVLYYNQMIRFYKHSNNYIEIVRCLLAMYEDKKGDSAEGLPMLKQIVWYLVLCPAYSTADGAGSDYITLRSSVAQDSRLSDIPAYNDLLQLFITEEVAGIRALGETYGQQIDEQPTIFGGDDGAKRRADLNTRMSEHNVLAVCKYYSQLRMARLAHLLDLEVHEAEAQLADLVVKGAVDAKIDRPAGIVRFNKAQDATEVLDDWGGAISKLLGLVETTCQKIQKESMQHHVPIGSAA